jgi:nucleotide-binding universal stress UspA family protein
MRLDLHEVWRTNVMAFKHILCPIDLSDASAATLAHATRLAQWYDAKLSVLHVAPTFEPMQVPPGDFGDPVRILMPMSREEILGDMRRVVDLAGATATATLLAESGDAPHVIIDRAVALSADLLVMGTHGRRGFRRLLLGSVAETVLREAPCPVFTVPLGARAADADTVSMERILCAVDFSPAALQGFGLAIDLAGQSGAALTLLHVVEWPAEEPRENVHFNVPEYRRYLTDQARERLDTLVAAESRPPRADDTVITSGKPYREILRSAESASADLIVMGTHGGGAIEVAFFGSTAQHVLRGAKCPVLTVRAPGTPPVVKS